MEAVHGEHDGVWLERFGTTAANGPYDDTEADDGLLHYAYRKGDPWSGDNRKPREAMTTGQPLILFRKEVAKLG